MSKEKIKSEEPAADTASQEGKVGTMLHDVRTKKKISIEEVAKDLYIKPAYLIAIEKSDYPNIPDHPYGVGFVRSYANYLGLNSARIVQIFKEETEGSAPAAEEYKVFTPSEEPEVTSPNRRYLIISLIMLIAAYAAWNIYSSAETNVDENMSITAAATDSGADYPLQVENFATTAETTEEEKAPELQQITVTDADFTEPQPEEETSAVETPKEETVKPVEEKPAEKPVATTEQKKGRVVLKVKKETWIEVKDKDKLWISKVLQAGKEYVVPENGVGKTVSFGNTDGVDVIIDGKVVTVVSPGKKTNIRLDAFLNNNH